ncbi:MAG: hypothetical protein COA78_11595 [Blastopirellula sp.]|nr:MAG: hypothetical protein COA78_11595 [Blastopirellula sp.]
MPNSPPESDLKQNYETVLGYLNYSSGRSDPKFVQAFNQIYAMGAAEDSENNSQTELWKRLGASLKDELNSLKQSSSAFSESSQADAVLSIVFDHLLPGYLEFHRDLLFHQKSDDLFLPFFLSNCFETVLQHQGSFTAKEQIAEQAIQSLNDYIGHRPVATLETQKIESYPHEFCRPVPIYAKGVGASHGPYQEVIEIALEMIGSTSSDILYDACFDPSMLHELAFDPRAYDFDHPVNRRPNYQFGQWDPDHLDNDGYYTRFVVQQVTLDALVRRITDESKIAREELVIEAAAVLAGVILMGAGISGFGPEAHSSEISLGTLLPKVASYRDRFYEELFSKIEGEHGARLQAEATERRQPFGAARQHLNTYLSNRRAKQLSHVHLAQIYARMGYPDAASEQVDVVPTASARMQCRIGCFVTLAHQSVEQADLEKAIQFIDRIIDRLQRAIQCGAIVDPWNILGFDGQFSLFPAMENSIRDHRVDDLIRLVEHVMTLMSHIWSEAAATDNTKACQEVDQRFVDFSDWWYRFAAHQVSSFDVPDAKDSYDAAKLVADALTLWHQGGAEAGNVRFWGPHANLFDSPKAYAMVIEALLERRDFVASMALLIHWIERADEIDLQQGESSFFFLIQEWVRHLRNDDQNSVDHEAESDGDSTKPTSNGPLPPDERSKAITKFLDYLEANAGELWTVPNWFSTPAESKTPSTELEELFHPESPEGEEDIYGAAYEDVTYADSTDDGVDGSIFEEGSDTEEELQAESKRVNGRLAFLDCLAKLWQVASVEGVQSLAIEDPSDDRLSKMVAWRNQAINNYRNLMHLLNIVQRHSLGVPQGDHRSLVEFDRQRAVKEYLVERIIATTVSTASAARLVSSTIITAFPHTKKLDEANILLEQELGKEQVLAIRILAGMLGGEEASSDEDWNALVKALNEQPLLYVPVSKGGSPGLIVGSRIRQATIRELLVWLPRTGQFERSRQLLETARRMERDNPVGPGAITEFDALFETGYKAMVQALVTSAESWDVTQEDRNILSNQLVECLEQMTQHMLIAWLSHSRTLRLSSVEKFTGKARWNQIVAFIERYGNDLFTQHFFNRGNIRSILHQGVRQWVDQVRQQLPEDQWPMFMSVLGDSSEMDLAVDSITVILEAILENYPEYRDYNSTTTQSDRGEMLYMFLEFLKLRVSYDRVAWNLRPVFLAHEILIRRGHNEAAEMWRSALAERIGDEAKRYVTKLRRLQKKYSMRMPTVADRIQERFLQPLSVDRVCSLVKQAMEEAGKTNDPTAFNLLQKEATLLVKTPSGVGLDIPVWLVSLEEEVLKIERKQQYAEEGDEGEPLDLIPERRLTIEEVHAQIDSWSITFESESDVD